MEYTKRWKEHYQIRSVTFLDGREDPNLYDIVYWEKHDPIEVRDWQTGEKRISTESCFSIGHLEWDAKNDCFEFHSCGTRFLEYYTEGLNEWLLKFIEFETFCRTKEESEED